MSSVEALLFFRRPAIGNASALLRDAANTANSGQACILLPLTARDQEFLDGVLVEEGEQPIKLALCSKDASTGSLWILRLSVYSDVSSPFRELYLASSTVPAETDRNWRLANTAFETLARVMRPCCAFQTLTSVEGRRDHLPSWRQIPEVGPPRIFTPVTYLGSQQLSDGELTKRLGSLPAWRSEAVGEGWILQASRLPWIPPSPEFIQALQAIPPGAIRFATAY